MTLTPLPITRCQVAELTNGSVLLTSRNFYDERSGYGPRLFARSDDGGATWAANWSATDLPDSYCEGSLLSGDDGVVYFANPSATGRWNMSVHRSTDGGRSWPVSTQIYAGSSAYSDLAFLRNGSVGVLFERDNYGAIAFGVAPPLSLAGLAPTLSLPGVAPPLPPPESTIVPARSTAAPKPRQAAPPPTPREAPLAHAVSLERYPMATCLDGSPGRYYIRKGHPSKFLIFHQV